MHFHLFTQHDMVRDRALPEQAETFYDDDGDICVFAHPAPDWDVHWVMKPARSDTEPSAYFRAVLRCIDRLDADDSLAEKGYSLVCQYRCQDGKPTCPVFHLIAGKRRA